MTKEHSPTPKAALGIIAALGTRKVWQSVAKYILPIILIALAVDTSMKINPGVMFQPFKMKIIVLFVIAYVIEARKSNRDLYDKTMEAMEYISSIDKGTKGSIANEVARYVRATTTTSIVSGIAVAIVLFSAVTSLWRQSKVEVRVDEQNEQVKVEIPDETAQHLKEEGKPVNQ